MRKMKPSGVEWIGDIPQEWEVIKLKYATEFKQIKYSEEYGELNYIGLENIISWNGMYLETSSQYDREQSLICEENDILFGKLRPYLAKVYLNTKRQCCSSEFCVIKILENNTKYFWYQLISHGFIFMVDRSTYGTKMPRANSDFIRSLYVSIPPLSEQQRIAEFLDRKCAEIDSIIAKTKATVEEYKALKQVVITQAVTKGIRPDRPMKDSGVEWIGDIPQEWEVVKLKRVAKIQTGSTPSKSNDEEFYSQESGYLWIKAEDLGYNSAIKKTAEFLSEKGIIEGRLFPPNTVYVCCIASIGKVGYTDVFASCNQQINAIQFIGMFWKYGYYLTISQEREYISNASGNVVKILNTDKQVNLMCTLPPLPEQQRIADYLDHKCAEIDRLIAAKEQLLTELESYKKSVIYEYVTGKKDV